MDPQQEQHQDQVSHRRRHLGRLVVGALTVAAFLLAVGGFSQYYAPQADEPPSGLDVLYYSLRLFVTEWDIPEGQHIPLALEFARWLAPISGAALLGLVVLTVFWEQAQVLRSHFASDHAVVCGLGRKGRALVNDLLDKGEKVVAIEKDDGNPSLRSLRRRGVPVISGDATEPTTLRWARVSRAKAMFAVSGDDATNLEIASESSKIRAKAAGSCICAIHVADDNLADLFADAPLLSGSGRAFQAHLFSVDRFAARAVLEKFPPDEVSERIHEPDGPTAQVFVFGGTGLATELVLQLARIGHYGSKKPPLVRVIADRERGGCRALETRRTVIRELLDMRIQTVSLDELLSSDEALETMLRADDLSPTEDCTIFVCLSEVATGLRLGSALARLGQERVVVCLPYPSNLRALVASMSGRPSPGFEIFDVFEETCTQDIVERGKLDARARVIHNHYRKEQSRPGHAPNPALVEWSQLSEALKESNRSQADHMLVKGRAAGLVRDRSLMRAEVSSAARTLLAELEHRRWYAERRLAGWRHTPNEKKDLIKRTSPAVVPWEKLSEEERKKDEFVADHLPKLLELTEPHWAKGREEG